MDRFDVKAWLLFATTLASRETPAARKHISEVADGINHAVPTDAEMKSGLAWLKGKKYIARLKSGYSTTASGKRLVAKAQAGTLAKTWQALSEAMRERHG